MLKGYELENIIIKIGSYLDGKIFDLLNRRLRMAHAMGDKITARTLVLLLQRFNVKILRFIAICEISFIL